MPRKIFEQFHQLKRARTLRKTQVVAKRARRGKVAKAFISQPMVSGVGSAPKGLQLASGNFLIDGRLIRDPNEPIWDIESDNAIFQIKAQSFFWLDHLAANGSPNCDVTARKWFANWLERYGDGNNFAWSPELAGARIIRLVNHALILLGNTTERDHKNYFASISHHARFLKKCWEYAPEGLPRFQALVGYVYSALALEEFAKNLKPALRALGNECENYIADDGGIPTRNPEELLDIFTLLVWVDQGMTLAAITPDRALLDAIERIALAMRNLRMGNGRLIEFHGGRAATKSRIEQILLDSGARSQRTSYDVMGYSRVVKEDSRLLMDTGAAPDAGTHGAVFDCALAFEFSSGQYPIFNSIGSGHDLSDQHRKNSRTAAAFSVASLLPLPIKPPGQAVSANLAPNTEVAVLRSRAADDATTILSATHTGYRDAFGLVYNRKLEMAPQGNILAGVERFYCESKKDQVLFDLIVIGQDVQSLPFAVRFHIAPDVEATLDLGGTAVSLQLPDNKVWIFKAVGGAIMLEDSTYYTSERLKPRATKQIVVTSDIVNYEGEVTWMLTCLEG